MTESPAPLPRATSGGSRFDERLSVPWWWYVIAAGLGVLLGAEVHMGYPGLRAWVGYVVLVPLFLALTWRMGRTRVRVADGRLQVGEESVPLDAVGRVEIVRKQDKQVALGPELDPEAFMLHRGWVPSLVRVEVVGQPDGTPPYWIFSVRDAEGLVSALGRA
ncbi:MAG TPA: DUF3093 domain-containing protein [Pseudonocardia sp.]|nr:DUF3093 domain-containing protein [Pseudonocardia sp.]